MANRDMSVSIEANPETDIDAFRLGDPTGILGILFVARETPLTIPGPVGAAAVTRSSVQRATNRLESMDSVRSQETPRRDDCAIHAVRPKTVDRKPEMSEEVSAREYPTEIEIRKDPPGILTGTIRRTAHQEEPEGVLFTPNGAAASDRISNYHQ